VVSVQMLEDAGRVSGARQRCLFQRESHDASTNSGAGALAYWVQYCTSSTFPGHRRFVDAGPGQLEEDT